MYGEKKMLRKIIVIEWVDSGWLNPFFRRMEYDDAEWNGQEDEDSLVPCKIKSAGLLIRENKLSITIASSMDESDPDNITYGGLLSIPTSVITKRSDFPESSISE